MEGAVISPFELIFPLLTLILGLALTKMASDLHKLLLAGRRVAWAPEPILLASLVMLLIILIWLNSWNGRNATSFGIWQVILEVMSLLILYFTAASCLPEPESSSDHVDTYAYYDRTRILSFGSLLASYLLFIVNQLAAHGWPKLQSVVIVGGWLLYLALYAALILIRARWFNVLALSLALLLIAWTLVGAQIAA